MVALKKRKKETIKRRDGNWKKDKGRLEKGEIRTKRKNRDPLSILRGRVWCEPVVSYLEKTSGSGSRKKIFSNYSGDGGIGMKE